VCFVIPLKYVEALGNKSWSKTWTFLQIKKKTHQDGNFWVKQEDVFMENRGCISSWLAVHCWIVTKIGGI
jgi:hypothetical protein